MQILINRHECCGHAQCAEVLPNVFAIDSQQKSTVLDPEAASLERVLEAAEACPCGAIVVEDDEGEQIFP
jgi:ferredoxin